MGAPMARNLAGAGFELAVFDVDAERTRAAADDSARAPRTRRPPRPRAPTRSWSWSPTPRRRRRAVRRRRGGGRAARRGGRRRDEHDRPRGGHGAGRARARLRAARRAGLGRRRARRDGRPAGHGRRPRRAVRAPRARPRRPRVDRRALRRGARRRPGGQARQPAAGGVHIAAAAEALAYAEALGLDPRRCTRRDPPRRRGLVHARRPRLADADPGVLPTSTALDIFVKDMGLVVERGRRRRRPHPARRGRAAALSRKGRRRA